MFAERITPTIVYLAMLGYLLSASLSIQMGVAIQIGYALCALVAIALPLALQWLGPAPAPQVRRWAAIGIAVSSLFLIPAAILPEGRSLQHVLVDFATTIVPIGFFVIGMTAPQVFRRILEPTWVMCFFGTALLAPLIVDTAMPARAFEPPGVAVIGIVAAVAMRRPPDWKRETAGATGLVVLAALGALSGSRSIFLIALFAVVASMLTNRPMRGLVALLVVAMLIAGATDIGFDAGIARDNPIFASASRLTAMSRGASADLRVAEAAMVFEDTRRRSDVWLLVGMGHGAMFEPETWHQPRTISAAGFVHNIHIGPVLLLFRYGLLGIALYVALLVHAVATVIRQLRRKHGSSEQAVLLLYSFGTLLFLIEFWARNVLPNPLFSFFIAGHLAMALQRSAADPAAPSPEPL